MIDRRFLNVGMTVLGVANSPGADPVAGDQYIVGSSGSGAFSDVAANSVARYNGTKWNFFKPKADGMELLNVTTGFILRYDGSKWDAVASINGSVIFVLDILPITTSYLKDSDFIGYYKYLCDFGDTYTKRIYARTSANGSWSTDYTELSVGDRYASCINFKLYDLVAKKRFTTTEIMDGSILYNKADGCLYVYDKAEGKFLRNGSEVIATEIHTLTSSEVTAKKFSLRSVVAEGKENQVILFVNGVLQIAGTDFTASGSTISWTDKALDESGTNADDVCVILYTKA